MNNLKITLVTCVLTLYSSILFSQNKWSAEFRPGVNFPTEDFGDSNIKTGFGFEVTVGYQFIEHLSGYAGWGYNTFEIEESNFDFDETGYTFGLQFIHPFGTSETLSYLLRAGGIYNHLELEDSDGDLIDDSGHGMGYQIEGGINYNVANNWSLRPTIRYRALSRDLNIENNTFNTDLNYLSFGLGIVKTF